MKTDPSPVSFPQQYMNFLARSGYPIACFGIRRSATSSHDTLVLSSVSPVSYVVKTGCPISRAFFAREVGILRTLLANRLSCGFPQTGIAGKLRRLVGRFPGEVRVAAPKVPVRRSLPVNRPPQIERFDDPAR